MDRPLLALPCLLAVALSGCTGFEGSFGAGAGAGAGGTSVSNQRDAFTYSGGVADKTGTDAYRWENGGTAAHVDFSGGGTGTVTVTVKDAAGLQVYRKGFSGSGGESQSGSTARGAPGTWEVRVSFEDYSGGFSLSLVRST